MEKKLKGIKINKKYVIDTLIVAVSIGIFIYSYMFLGSAVKGYISTENNIQSKIEASSENDSVIQAFKKSDVGQMDYLEALPTQNTITNWIGQEEEIATLAGVSSSISFTNGELTKDNIVLLTPPKGNIPLLNTNIVIRGTYNQILSYITMLDNDYYYTRINSITLAAASGQNVPAHTVTASLNVDLFVQDISQNVGQ